MRRLLSIDKPDNFYANDSRDKQLQGPLMYVTQQHPAAASASVASKRYFFEMDAVRAALMLLGVPFHAIFGDGRRGLGWSDDAGAAGLDLFADVLHSFRMEAFFIVAGYFAAMVLARSTVRGFLGGRALRIGLPLLTCTLLFTPLGPSLVVVPAGQVARIDVASAAWFAPLGPWWVMHLWFLHTLILHTLLLGASVALVRRWLPAARSAQRLSVLLSRLTLQRFVVGGVVLALVATGIWIVPGLIKRVFGVGLRPWGPFFDLRLAIHYLPMFALGVAIWAKPDLKSWFSRRDPLVLPVALAASALFVIGSRNPALAAVLVPVGACFAGIYWA